ncbi:MAG: hypothetical protein AAGF10_06515 [Verrucomicrobiota bacterium]
MSEESTNQEESNKADHSTQNYEKQDYGDYPKAKGKDKALLIGLVVGLVVIGIFIVLAVGF